MRKILLIIPLVLSFIIEWVLDMVNKLVAVVHDGFKALAIATETEFNKTKLKPGEPDSGKV